MRTFLFVLSLLVFAGCAGKEKAKSIARADPTETTATAEPPAPIVANNAVATNAPTAGDTKWQYEKRVDQQGRTVYKASTVSPKLLEFDFPYNGGSVATLTIRKRASDTHVYIQVSKGQFNRSFQGGQARVRFDGAPPVSYAFSAAENGSANVIFFDAGKALVDKLKTSRTMDVDVDFAGQGKRQITFRTDNLNWNH
ncbi:hypothetical protein [Spirosoma koreense]